MIVWNTFTVFLMYEMFAAGCVWIGTLIYRPLAASCTRCPSASLKCWVCTASPFRDDITKTTPTPFTITTPIFYVNAVPHIGHIYTGILADTLARWQRLKGSSVLFSTGTDEHGMKIQQAAKLGGLSPQAFCDQVSNQFKEAFNLCGIRYDDFVRTTEARHTKAVCTFWNRLVDRGLIYRGTYEGWYSTSDEAFLTNNQVSETKDSQGNVTMVSAESGQPVEWTNEENYMFRLSQFSAPLLQWLDKAVIKPSHFEPLVRNWIEEGLQDLSVSRRRDKQHWGIPVPGDDSQTIYVWLDALVNYMTVVGYPANMARWPVDFHIVGKDILKFHAVYWPAFLIGAGYEPPKSILCHSHWLMDNLKMSKSRGNVVDPVDRVQQYSSDGLRYFLLRVGVPHSDGNYNDLKVVECLNAELANTLGNLLSRCTSKTINSDKIFPRFDSKVFSSISSDDEKRMLEMLEELPDVVDGHIADFHINKAVDVIMSQLRKTNTFVENHKPWELVKNPERSSECKCVISYVMETLCVCGILLQPIVPKIADSLLTRLNIPSGQRSWNDARVYLFNHGHTLGPNTNKPLFSRLKL